MHYGRLYHSKQSVVTKDIVMIALMVLNSSGSYLNSKHTHMIPITFPHQNYSHRYGFQAQLIEGAPGKNPLVFARLGHDPKLPTVTVYGHYDVFPVKKAEWSSDPFTLTGKNGYLYGRGTSDDKGPILAILFAAADLQADGALPVNLSFVIEGEEEATSAGFVDAMRDNIHWFKDTDVILLSNSVWLGENKVSTCSIHFTL